MVAGQFNDFIPLSRHHCAKPPVRCWHFCSIFRFSLNTGHCEQHLLLRTNSRTTTITPIQPISLGFSNILNNRFILASVLHANTNCRILDRLPLLRIFYCNNDRYFLHLNYLCRTLSNTIHIFAYATGLLHFLKNSTEPQKVYRHTEQLLNYLCRSLQF